MKSYIGLYLFAFTLDIFKHFTEIYNCIMGNQPNPSHG